jgi:large subunit ribosomal protein L30
MMILVIRIHGKIGLPSNIEETLYRMRLRKKYSAIVLPSSIENQKMLKKVRSSVAYGEINKETLKKLLDKRAKLLDTKEKVDSDKIIVDLEKKPLKELGVKPFFSLHPPRGGIDSKKHFGKGKGVLGDNKEKINELLARML